MATTLILIEFLIVLFFIFLGARVGSIGLGIYGMVGTFILVFLFGLKPGTPPIDVMLIIVSVICAAASLQAAGGIEYLVGLAGKFLRKHPSQITFYGPLCTWVLCLVCGTAHTSYSLLPIISEIATNEKIRPERPLSVATIAASLGITGSPVSAATAALLSSELLGSRGIQLKDILLICLPASFIAILVAAIVENFVGKDLKDDPEYQRRVKEGIINPEEDRKKMQNIEFHPNPRAKWATLVFFLGVLLVVFFGLFPSMRPHFMVDGVSTPIEMSQTIEMIMMSISSLILIVGKAKPAKAVQGNIFAAGMNAMVAIFGVAWMGDTFFNGNLAFFKTHIADIVTQYPFLFAIALFIMSIMLFSQAAAVRTLYPLGIALGISPLALVVMFPAANGYFFLPNYPTEVAAISFDRTGTTHIGKWVINHSFQLPGFITTIVAIGISYLTVKLFY
ncbi:MAG: anaerobic C4-dicarboxylate transporter [Prevotella sp.]|jgi:anaerobic C4-dicarboxylate transporter DcuA|nr:MULTISPECIES: anaerobic C4-dicarboxylate transporter [unclassified Prevotella]MCH3984724.1 anaerobic C4-dicarboxylate transporter [Prevotella sp.]MCH3992624.1 anaerobic C4-dicarboxylate transporter [Prevotella sp.]MCH4186811.1 anaerobic C4-dicarboxylate transporter [Prevotella sp.]MCH4216746.1 anaerobic C4-dicarboxylate transporter [Prevotella sp.]MCH4252108.1 anaerobic C4-dicarboxylate transporter [Prevotella sp.]